MKTLVIFGILMLTSLSIQAQSLSGDKAVTYFYMVNLDRDLTDVLNFQQTSDSSGILIDKAFMASIADTFYTIAMEKLTHELGIELLPLKELQGKVKYNSNYPQCPSMVNLKKVLKNASGYKYYTDYFVNVYSDLRYSPTILISMS